MLHLLDNLLRHLFMTQIDEITDATQVGFQPPDENWRAYVATLNVGGQPANALNVYLFALNEHRTLRSNEKVRNIENGMVSQKPVPFRMECQYLITAWSPAGATPALEPTLDEHALLYKTTAAIINKMPLNPTDVYGKNSPALQNWPESFRDTVFPTLFLPVDDFTKMSEFWTSMGEGARWKPALRLMVTLPVEIFKDIKAPMVTARIIEYRLIGAPQKAEALIPLSGVVQSGSPPVPVVAAEVILENPTDQTQQKTTTGLGGRFAFENLKPSKYTLRVVAAGFADKQQSIEVHSADVHYDALITLS
jgi:hypothetical protein